MCEDCSSSGIYNCDRCRPGYYFDEWDQQCYDLTCKIKQCDVCDDNPNVCEVCAKNYWLDVDKNECIDGKCQIENCDDCSISGPMGCDKAADGYYIIEK